MLWVVAHTSNVYRKKQNDLGETLREIAEVFTVVKNQNSGGEAEDKIECKQVEHVITALLTCEFISCWQDRNSNRIIVLIYRTSLFRDLLQSFRGIAY